MTTNDNNSLKTSLTVDELIVHFTYRVKLVQHKIETSLSTDEFKKMQTILKKCKTSSKVSVMNVETEISSSLSSSRFYTVELKFWLTLIDSDEF